MSTMFRCPIQGCESVVKRIDRHLRTKHKLQTCNEDYKRYKSVAENEAYKLSVQEVLSEEAEEEDAKSHDSVSNDDSDGEDNDEANEVELDDDALSLEEIEEVEGDMRGEAEAFRQWLQSFGGGNKSQPVSNQICTYVVVVLRAFGVDFSLNDLTTNLDKLEVQDAEDKTGQYGEKLFIEFQKVCGVGQD